jgi:hypothetical protein
MKHRSSPPRVTAETPTSLDDLWALVSRGRAISVLPQFMVSRLQGDGVCAIPLLDVDPLEVSVGLLRGDGRPAVRSLRASLERLARERPSSDPRSDRDGRRDSHANRHIPTPVPGPGRPAASDARRAPRGARADS